MAPEGRARGRQALLDVVGASAALVLARPVMLAAALAIRLTSGGPVIYAQERYGLNRRRFRMFKFRTMVRDAERLQASLESQNEASGPVFKIADDPRITPVGRFLRRTLDRRAAAALQRAARRHVAGRPAPAAAARRRRASRARATCAASACGPASPACGRSAAAAASASMTGSALDLQYIDRWSLALDLLILVRTIPAVLRGTGAR